MKINWSVQQGLIFYFVWYFAVVCAQFRELELFSILILSFFFLWSLVHVIKIEAHILKYSVIVAILGSTIDSIGIYLNLAEFPAHNITILNYPAWLTILWMGFALCIPACLSSFNNKLLVQFLFGLIGGPLSIYAAHKLGTIEFVSNIKIVLGFYALEWAIILPIIFLLFNKICRNNFHNC
jgi:hypothetical protein